MIYSWLNFTVFVGLLCYFLREPIQNFLKNRAESLGRALDIAAQNRQAMEVRYQEIRHKLNGSDAEVLKLKEELKEEGLLEQKRLLEKSHGYAEKIREDAKRMGDQEVEKARARIQQEIFLSSLQLAKSKLAQRLDAKGQEKLVSWGIQNLGGAR